MRYNRNIIYTSYIKLAPTLFLSLIGRRCPSPMPCQRKTTPTSNNGSGLSLLFCLSLKTNFVWKNNTSLNESHFEHGASENTTFSCFSVANKHRFC